MYLSHRIKCIELSTHYSRLVWYVAFWKAFKSRTVDTLPRTSPKFGQQRNDSYAREISHISLPKNLGYTLIYDDTAICDHLVVSFDKCHHRDRISYLIPPIDVIAHLLKSHLGRDRLFSLQKSNDLIYEIDFGNRFIPGRFRGLS